MKYVGILVGVLVWTSLSAQKTFDTEYARIMATVKQWESAPDSIIRVRYRNGADGRKAFVKMSFITKRQSSGGVKKDITYSKIYRVKNSRKGMVEIMKIYVSYGRIGLIRKVNGKYMTVRVHGDVIILEKTIITDIHSEKKMYFRNEKE